MAWSLGILGAASGSVPIIASGGSVTESGIYRIHTFTSSGTFSVSQAPAEAEFEYLIIAGGASGGSERGDAGAGGGGAGGYLSSVLTLNEPSNLLVTIGAGGPASTSPGRANGSNSNISHPGGTITAIGGGAGGGRLSSGSSYQPNSGGSGGGSRSSTVGGAGTPGQGSSGGGYWGPPTFRAGGGGGAGGPGGSPGPGGAGISSSITGTAVVRAEGGRAGFNVYVGGGTGVSSGEQNSGSGGSGAAGASGSGTRPGGSGGSGVVIIRYKR